MQRKREAANIIMKNIKTQSLRNAVRIAALKYRQYVSMVPDDEFYRCDMSEVIITHACDKLHDSRSFEKHHGMRMLDYLIIGEKLGNLTPREVFAHAARTCIVTRKQHFNFYDPILHLPGTDLL